MRTQGMSNKAILGVSLAALLAGCHVTPKPITPGELATRADENAAQVTANQEPVAAPIGLYDAMARALKYNLDYKVEMMDEALKARELNLASYDMLPQLVASGGYAGRNNYAGASSLSLITRRQSLEPSTSSDRGIFSGDLSLSWDVLDFGLSYVRAQQKANEGLISLEHRRKVSNRIIEDVRTAYWRAVSAERLLAKLHQLEGAVSTTLSNSERLAERRLSAPLTALTYQRELIDIKTNIQQLQRELVIAKSQLGALMNLQPGTEFSLVMPERTAKPPAVSVPGEEMVMTALRNRSELREINYRERINKKELDAALLSALPSLKGVIGANVDSNSFLFNSDWLQYGARASWNVLNLFKLPAQKKVIKAQDNLLHQRELALTMAVMTQVHVARANYAHLTDELDTASHQYAVQNKIMYQIRSGFKAGAMSQQTLLREEMNTLVSEVKYDIAYAAAQNAYANLFSAMGIDEFAPDVTGRENVATLSTSLSTLWDRRATALKLD
jgi:outer membrane protein TolC